MKRIFQILAVALCVTAMAACSGDKDNSGNSGTAPDNGNEQPAGGDQAVLSGQNWQTDYAQGPVFALMFNSNHGTSNPVLVDDAWLRRMEVYANGNESEPVDWIGKFTYTGTATQGSGEITLKTEVGGEDAGKATFTISGTTLNLSYNNETSVLKKIE